jgi:hypothetical protein
VVELRTDGHDHRRAAVGTISCATVDGSTR